MLKEKKNSLPINGLRLTSMSNDFYKKINYVELKRILINPSKQRSIMID